MSEISRLLSNKVKVKSPIDPSLSVDRYDYLALEEAEPNLDAPTVPPGPGQVYVLISDTLGNRQWFLIDEGGQGIQGVQGITGEQGVQGIQGFGIQGIQGFQGTQGTGDQGVQGIQGNLGVQGVDGTSVNIIGSEPDVQATYNGGLGGPVSYTHLRAHET